MIQLIRKEGNKFYMSIHSVDCLFIPVDLFLGNNLFPLNKKVKGSTLGWYVHRKFISYNKIRSAIKKNSAIMAEQRNRTFK